jgi:DNA-binding transcriptional ArsR family regulator
MIELRMAAGDFTQMRFAYSPVSEAINSLNMLRLGRVPPLHRGWADIAREHVRGLDTALLRAIVPARRVAMTPPLDINGRTTIEHQLKLVADWPPDLLCAELDSLWQGFPMPAAAREVIADGPSGARRIAAALRTYWDATIAPYWDQMQAVLDADIAYRARRVALGGISALLEDLHPQLQLDQSTIRINKTSHYECDLTGKGVLLIPCVFAGPNIMFDPGGSGPPTIVYGPRGLGTVWETTGASRSSEDALSALMGRGRAAILRCVELPRTTTELARVLGLSGATVSVHLSTLKRCGMVTSWRSGRRVLYQRTPLALSVLSAVSHPPPPDDASSLREDPGGQGPAASSAAR